MASDPPPFVIAHHQFDDNIFYIRRWDGSTSHQDVAVICVFGKIHSPAVPREVLEWLSEKLGSKTIEQLLAEAEDRHEAERRKEQG